MDSSYMNLEALMAEAGLLTSPPSQPTPVSIPSTPPTLVIEPDKPKVKFMLVGTHAHQTTGYSKVTYHLIQELAKNPQIEIYHFGFQKFMKAPPDYRVYPKGVDVHDTVQAEQAKTAKQEMGFGFSQLPDYVRKVKPDMIMIYNDAGVICQFLDSLANNLQPSERTYKMYIYLDQVYTIQRPDFLARMDKDAEGYFVFTQYWKSILEKQGIKKPIHIMRHGFNPEQFKPMDRLAMRRKHNIPENLFVFLNLNRNTPRKRYDLVVTAFAKLVARNPTKPLALLCICDGGESGGFLIQEIFIRELENLGVPLQFHAHKLMISKSALTHTDELINELYALSDVGITAADGEGFGLCQFEAMGVGIPQVVPYIGGFRDFCKNNVNSLTVKPKNKYYLPLASSSVGGCIEVIDPDELCQAAEKYIMDSDMRAEHGAAARKTVLEYKWANEVKPLVDVILSIKK